MNVILNIMKKYSRSFLFKSHLVILSVATIIFTMSIIVMIILFLINSSNESKAICLYVIFAALLLSLVVMIISVYLKCDNCKKFTNSTTLKGSGEIKALPDWKRLYEQIMPSELKSNYFKCKNCGLEYTLK